MRRVEEKHSSFLEALFRGGSVCSCTYLVLVSYVSVPCVWFVLFFVGVRGAAHLLGLISMHGTNLLRVCVSQ